MRTRPFRRHAYSITLDVLVPRVAENVLSKGGSPAGQHVFRAVSPAARCADRAAVWHKRVAPGLTAERSWFDYRCRFMENCLPTCEEEMAWKAPKIVEVAVGMEINMYACAERR